MRPKTLHCIAAAAIAAALLPATYGGGFEWASYLGGIEDDRPGFPNGVKVAADGTVWVIGDSWSDDFPTMTGAYQEVHAGTRDVVIAQFSADGSSLLYSTFLGGGAQDYGYTIAFDAQGRLVVGGDTWSPNFPTTHGAYSTTHAGGQTDAWFAVLDPSEAGADQLVYSTYLGGSGATWDWANEVLPVAADTYLIVGGTSSPDMPTSLGAYDTTYNGGDWDAFVAVLNVAAEGAAQLAYCSFLGGEDTETITNAGLDGNGNIVVSGRTASVGFPTTTGAYQETIAGDRDAFVARLDPTLTTLVDSTLLGGPGDDANNGMVLDPSGSIYIGGWAAADFPVTAGAYDPTFNGGSTAFPNDNYVSRLSSDLTQLLASTYIGGTNGEGVNAITLDATTGAVTVTGSVASHDYPVTPDGAQQAHGGGAWDSFITRLNADLSSVTYSTYVGGSSNVDYGYAMDDDQARRVTIAMLTLSADAPATDGAYQTLRAGQHDIFIAQVNVCQWDIDGDGQVGINDFLDLLAAWGPNPGHPADFDGDGIVGISDFLDLLANWGPCT